MEDKKTFKTVTDGVHILSETENENQFYFYRKDGRVLGNVGRLPMDMYEHYVCTKMIESNQMEIISNKIEFETSTDGTCIRLTTMDFGVKISLPTKVEPSEETGMKKLIKSIFNNKKR